MTEHGIELHRDVEAAPESVWAVLTDLEHAAETLSGVTRVEVLTDGPYRVGTRWRETRTMLGKEATEEMEVTAVEAPVATTIEAESGGVHYRTVFTLAPAAGGARLTMAFSARQPERTSRLQRLIWPVLGRLGVRVSTKVMTRDLEDIARRAESHA